MIPARRSKGLDLAEIRSLSRCHTGRCHHIHVIAGKGRSATKMLGRNLTLLLECRAAKIEPLPAALLPHPVNLASLRLNIGTFIDPCIVCPVTID